MYQSSWTNSALVLVLPLPSGREREIRHADCSRQYCQVHSSIIPTVPCTTYLYQEAWPSSQLIIARHNKSLILMSFSFLHTSAWNPKYTARTIMHAGALLIYIELVCILQTPCV